MRPVLLGPTPIRVLALEAGGPASTSALLQLRESGLSVKLIAADMDPNCAVSSLADEFYRVLPASNVAYIDEVIDLITRCHVDVVLPSFHFAMREFAELDHPAFVNDFTAGLVCQDKWQFYKWCRDNGYSVPETTLLAGSNKIKASKLYAKPRYGVGSKGNFALAHQELKNIADYLQHHDEYIIQEFIDGEMWVVDAMRCDRQFLGCTSARVITQRAGHAVAVEIITNPELAALAEDVLNKLDYEGPANFDVMRSTGGDYFILELNPRFGGTICFAHAAGINLPAYLLSRQKKFLGAPIEGRYSLSSNVVRL